MARQLVRQKPMDLAPRPISMPASIRDDIQSVLERDPAARSWLEVALLYPGLHAIWVDVLEHRELDLEAVLTAHLEPISRRLDLTLNN